MRAWVSRIQTGTAHVSAPCAGHCTVTPLHCTYAYSIVMHQYPFHFYGYLSSLACVKCRVTCIGKAFHTYRRRCLAGFPVTVKRWFWITLLCFKAFKVDLIITMTFKQNWQSCILLNCAKHGFQYNKYEVWHRSYVSLSSYAAKKIISELKGSFYSVRILPSSCKTLWLDSLHTASLVYTIRTCLFCVYQHFNLLQLWKSPLSCKLFM